MISEFDSAAPPLELLELTEFELDLLRQPDWSGAVRQKLAMIENMGIDQILTLARSVKSLERPQRLWVVTPNDFVMHLPGEVYVSLEVIKEWWDKHPLACGNIAVIPECALKTREVPFLPAPENFILPQISQFHRSLSNEGLPTELVDSKGLPLHILWGVIEPLGLEEEPEEEEEDEPKHIVRKDFANDVDHLVSSPERIVATIEELVRLANG